MRPRWVVRYSLSITTIIALVTLAANQGDLCQGQFNSYPSRCGIYKKKAKI